MADMVTSATRYSLTEAMFPAGLWAAIWIPMALILPLVLHSREVVAWRDTGWLLWLGGTGLAATALASLIASAILMPDTVRLPVGVTADGWRCAHVVSDAGGICFHDAGWNPGIGPRFTGRR